MKGGSLIVGKNGENPKLTRTLLNTCLYRVQFFAFSHAYARGGDTYPSGCRTPILLNLHGTSYPHSLVQPPRNNHCVVYGKISPAPPTTRTASTQPAPVAKQTCAKQLNRNTPRSQNPPTSHTTLQKLLPKIKDPAVTLVLP